MAIGGNAAPISCPISRLFTRCASLRVSLFISILFCAQGHQSKGFTSHADLLLHIDNPHHVPFTLEDWKPFDIHTWENEFLFHSFTGKSRRDFTSYLQSCERMLWAIYVTSSAREALPDFCEWSPKLCETSRPTVDPEIASMHTMMRGTLLWHLMWASPSKGLYMHIDKLFSMMRDRWDTCPRCANATFMRFLYVCVYSATVARH